MNSSSRLAAGRLVGREALLKRPLQLVPISCLAAFVVLPLVMEYLADHDLPQLLGCSVILAAIGLAMALGALPDPPCPPSVKP